MLPHVTIDYARVVGLGAGWTTRRLVCLHNDGTEVIAEYRFAPEALRALTLIKAYTFGDVTFQALYDELMSAYSWNGVMLDPTNITRVDLSRYVDDKQSWIPYRHWRPSKA